MSITAALDIASSGIYTVNNQLAVVANNIANQNTDAYATEVSNQTALNAGGIGMGVISTATSRDIDLSLQHAVYMQNSSASWLTTQNTALSAIDGVSGTTGSGNDLPSLLGDLQDAFTTLSSTPDSGAAQASVVTAASNVADGINSIADAITSQRQTAQNNIVADVSTLNSALSQIGTLNSQIVADQTSGTSIATLENQRDATEQTISNLLDVKFVTGANNAVQVLTNTGITLPTDGTQITTSATTITASSTYPASIPTITLAGTDITASLTGGSIGAAITLRDSTLPTRQAELDEFSAQLANRFSAQGLTLFSDAGGNVPSTGTPTQTNYVGFSSIIQVNPAVSADVSLVRDGTQDITGSATGASAFTTNSSGTAGFTTLINRVLDYSFGDDMQSGVAQSTIPTSGLGATGTISVDYSPGSSLSSFVSAFSASDAAEVANVSQQMTQATDTQTTLKNQLSAGSAVSVDAQMSNMVQLQNAYSANAKVISSVQSMFSSLISAINVS